jgi:hypothetical protein
MTGPADRRDKRRHLRIPLRVEIHDGEHWGPPEWAINLSSTGVGLQIRSKREVGERLRIRFRVGPDEPVTETEAEVGWCAKETDLTPGMQYYEMGLRFDPLPEETHRVLAAFVESGFHFWPDEESTLSDLESLRLRAEPSPGRDGDDPA